MVGRRPLIGVTGPENGGRVLWWFTRLGVRLARGRAVRLTSAQTHELSRFDGFVIAGGGDINPVCYGQSPISAEGQYDDARDALERTVIQHAIQHSRPMLGICRGMQMINIALGGTLHQEAKEVLEDFLPNESLISKIIGRRDVKIDPESQLFGVLGEYTQYWVNSIHHQAVDRLGDGLQIVAREENGLVQAFESVPDAAHPFLIGVQWHPELMLHASSARRLFRALVRAARGA